ncbi:MAG: glycosyltransferase family 4 protein [Caldilineaceae bacterium]
MSKVLLIGYNPPQLIQGVKIEAAHYRTWQFLEPLLDDGHEILLCAGARGEKAQSVAVPEAWAAQLQVQPIAFGEAGWITPLQAAHDRFQPDCIVAVNFSHCLYATKLRTCKPIWMDIYGDMMTIMQASFYRTQSDRGLETSIGFMHEVLRTGDAFSGCGAPQKHMTVGELAMAGRLNRRTFGYEFAHVVLPGSLPKPDASPKRAPKRQALAAHGIGDDEFVVLWCGGYNTWTDVGTLFRGLEAAMQREPRLRYVSVGANTYEAVDNTYTQLQTLIERSKYKDRFVLLGWRPWSEIPAYYRESDIGINIDALHYETLYGTRTRLTEMIASGLPVITTYGPELSYLLEAKQAGLTFAVGDWQTLGNKLAQIADDPEQRDQLAERALDYARNELSFAATTACVRQWVKAPKLAPDKAPKAVRDRIRNIEYRMRATLRHTLWRVNGSDK